MNKLFNSKELGFLVFAIVPIMELVLPYALQINPQQDVFIAGAPNFHPGPDWYTFLFLRKTIYTIVGVLIALTYSKKIQGGVISFFKYSVFFITSDLIINMKDMGIRTFSIFEVYPYLLGAYFFTKLLIRDKKNRNIYTTLWYKVIKIAGIMQAIGFALLLYITFTIYGITSNMLGLPKLSDSSFAIIIISFFTFFIFHATLYHVYNETVNEVYKYFQVYEEEINSKLIVFVEFISDFFTNFFRYGNMIILYLGTPIYLLIKHQYAFAILSIVIMIFVLFIGFYSENYNFVKFLVRRKYYEEYLNSVKTIEKKSTSNNSSYAKTFN